MKYFLGIILALAVGLLVFSLIKKSGNQDGLNGRGKPAMTATQPAGAGKHKATILEVIQASSYTYLRVKEGKNEIWLATILGDAKVGDAFSYSNALEMSNFTSKELNRTFPVIYFISQEQESPAGEQASAPTTMGKPRVELKADTVIPQSEGGIAIAELYKNRDKYVNKKIRIRGKVAKVNNEVMEKNFVHIQDGTSDSGNFDLTVTTLAFVKVDAIVEFEGTIALKKDFGAGYIYDVIMEGGILRK